MNQKESCLPLVENILEKIHNLPDGPFWKIDIHVKKQYRFPVTLDVGNGGHIYINPEINGLLASMSKSILQELFRPHKSDFTIPEWNQMTRKAFGEALIGPDGETIVRKDARQVLQAVTAKLRCRIDEIQAREYVFGCDLCNVQDLKSMSIGSVRFEHRIAWLERIHDRGDISKVAFSRIQRIWKGETLRERRFSMDMYREKNIIDTIGKCEFVCSVTVEQAGTEAGRQIALVAARIATAVIALSWIEPSYALDSIGLAFDREPYCQHNLVFTSENRYGHRSALTHIPGGITALEREEWNDIATNLETVYPCAGEVTEFLVSRQEAVNRPKIMNALFQALLWFHEGCREKMDAMAIVKYCAVLEALAGQKRKGGYKGRIIDLVKARLTINDEDDFNRRIERIYGEGRSRTVHGTNDELRHDWSEDRMFAEKLCRLCLLSCLQYASEDPTLDDPKLFSTDRKRCP